jgi:hypothetical protein
VKRTDDQQLDRYLARDGWHEGIPEGHYAIPDPHDAQRGSRPSAGSGVVGVTEMLAIALDYAAGAALVLPLHSPSARGRCSCMARGCQGPGKHPRTLHGKDDATTDPEKVASWWGMWPAANLGIRPALGLVVLDVDPRHGGDVQVAAMQRRYGRLPATRTARTGSGGEHLWFAHVGPVTGKLAPGVDIKSNSGYVVAPPSLHFSGSRYAWSDPGPIAAAPPYLARLLTPPPPSPLSSRRAGSPSAKVAAGLLRVVADAAEGNRNNALFWAACRAHEHGLDVGPLVDAAVANGLSRRAADATARSAADTARPGGVA